MLVDLILLLCQFNLQAALAVNEPMLVDLVLFLIVSCVSFIYKRHSQSMSQMFHIILQTDVAAVSPKPPLFIRRRSRSRSEWQLYNDKSWAL